jgi:hypothetical protein
MAVFLVYTQPPIETFPTTYRIDSGGEQGTSPKTASLGLATNGTCPVVIRVSRITFLTRFIVTWVHASATN